MGVEGPADEHEDSEDGEEEELEDVEDGGTDSEPVGGVGEGAV